MKYLFFDIESPDGSPYAICEFGYVITDENFNILDRNNLLINPEKKIKPIYRRGELKIKLFYPPYKYFQSPLFPSRYPVIRNLLTKDDVKVFGYSVSSDITYIRSTSTRYNLEQFNYSSYDVQLIYRDLMKLAKCTSLENAAQIVPESEKNNFSLHRADHDATITMLVLKHLVKNNNINLNEFLSSNENYKFNSQDPPKKNNKPNKSKTSKSKKKKVKKDKSPLQEKWGDFYRGALDKLESSKGKLCTISATIKNTEEDLNAAIELINTNGYVPCDKISLSDYLIVKDEEDEKHLLSILRHPYQGKIIKLK